MGARKRPQSAQTALKRPRKRSLRVAQLVARAGGTQISCQTMGGPQGLAALRGGWVCARGCEQSLGPIAAHASPLSRQHEPPGRAQEWEGCSSRTPDTPAWWGAASCGMRGRQRTTKPWCAGARASSPWVQPLPKPARNAQGRGTARYWEGCSARARDGRARGGSRSRGVRSRQRTTKPWCAGARASSPPRQRLQTPAPVQSGEQKVGEAAQHTRPTGSKQPRPAPGADGYAHQALRMAQAHRKRTEATRGRDAGRAGRMLLVDGFRRG